MKENRYRIIKKLAEGGTGETCLVWDKRLEQKWVMKQVLLRDGTRMEAVRREMSALKCLRHEGIPVLADVLYEKDRICLIMEYMTGVSLEERIRTQGPMEEEEAVKCALQIGELLQYLHQLPGELIHGDLKPLNLICHNGRMALLDFGGACFRQGGREQGCCYTPGYGAPELTERGCVSVRSDIYAFGAVLFYLVTGQHPAEGRGIYPVREQNPMLSPALEQMILKCTEEMPEKRYRSMEEVMEELKEMERACQMSGRRKRRAICRREKSGEKRVFRSIRSVLLTEGKLGGRISGSRGRAALLLLAGVLSAGTVPAQASGELLPVNLRNKAGEKLLVDFDAVYYTEENPIFEVPVKYFEAGREYEVTISQKERGKNGGTHRERTFIICVER